ncbi:MAG: hypothetical protein IAE81_20235 [Caldilineaceae bacterium]|nr:hypothetical protein [Caldilineaceae bacterium]
MARGRLLSTEASVDPELNSLSSESMLLYLLTLAHLDRDGLIDGHPMRLNAVAAPMRSELRDQAGALINEWVETGLVVRYGVGNGRNVLFFKGFRKHQQGLEYGREPASKYPPPPGWTRTRAGLIPDDPELCFRLAEGFHGKSSYRVALLDAAGADAPARYLAPEADPDPRPDPEDADYLTPASPDLPEPSRSPRDSSRSPRENFAPKIREVKRTVFGGGGVQTNTLTHPGYGVVGGDRGGTPPPDRPAWAGALEAIPTRLAQSLAEFSDDDLRLGADAAGQICDMHAEFNGWGRLLSAATRQDLLLILAWCTRWRHASLEEMEQVKSYPALLRSKLRTGEWPGLPGVLIDNIANQVEDALHYAEAYTEEES